MLGIVHDLNENIRQVAANLTEEWEKLEPPLLTSRMDTEPTSQPRANALVHSTRNRDPMGLTFLLQLYLCTMAVSTTSAWELSTLNSIYQRSSASGEHNVIGPG